MYKLFLSVRYLMKPLSIVAILALALSVTALTAAPAVMAGFQADFHERVRGTQSDIKCFSEKPLDIFNLEPARKALMDVPGVTGVAPYIEYPAIDRHLRGADYCFIRAIEPKLEEQVTQFRQFILSDYDRELVLEDYDTASASQKKDLEKIYASYAKKPGDNATPAEVASWNASIDKLYDQLENGAPDPDDPSKKIPCVLAGVFYLRHWGMDVGGIDTVKLTTATESGEVKQDRRFKVIGAIQTGTQKLDRQFLYMSLHSAQDFIGVPDRVTGYSVKVANYDEAPRIKKDLVQTAKRLMGEVDEHGRRLMANGIYVKTWEEIDETLLKAVGMEKFLIKFITSIIVVAASASIFLVVYMTANTKIRELGILRAMGGSRFGTFQIFVTQGSFLAVMGLALGSTLGLLIALYVNEISGVIYRLTGWQPFPPEVYYLERIPARVEPREIAINAIITLGFGVVFALIPAFLAASRPPIRAIRYE